MSAPPAKTRTRLSVGAYLVVLWGVGGVLLLLGQALWRLTPLAIEPVKNGQLTAPLWALYIGWAIINGYSEGYRGFQKRFSPRVIARALYLAKNPTPLKVLLAPAFCMSFFHATRRGLIAAYGILIMVICLVLLVRALPQPWRGIVDVGVVVGLTWGALSVLYFAVVGALAGSSDADPQLPDEKPVGAGASTA